MSSPNHSPSDSPLEIPPVLLIAFNRPDPTREVFAAIRRARPKRLYLAVDGPRGHVLADREKCAEVRKILDGVDWDCEVKTRYSEENLGCGRAVSGAIEWFLRDAGEGIILEDDTLPSQSFFDFCARGLEACRDDPSIGSVSGDCFLPGRLQTALSVGSEGKRVCGAYRSKYFNMWGWATWLDRWEGYSLDLGGRSPEEWDAILVAVHGETLETSVWRAIMAAMRAGLLDTWDFQFAFHAWARGQGHVVPTANLVTNLGFDDDATHTIGESPVARLPRHEFEAINIPSRPKPDPELDSLTFFLRHLESLKLSLWLKEAVLIELSDPSERMPFEKQLIELQKACNERMALINRMQEKIRRLQEQTSLTGRIKMVLRRLGGKT